MPDRVPADEYLYAKPTGRVRIVSPSNRNRTLRVRRGDLSLCAICRGTRLMHDVQDRAGVGHGFYERRGADITEAWLDEQTA